MSGLNRMEIKPENELEKILIHALALKYSGDLKIILGREPTPAECIAQAKWKISGKNGLCPEVSYKGN
jgi:hypothetical protein